MKYKNHPAIVSVEDYIRAAKKARCAIGAKKIFLATDDEEMLLSFQKASQACRRRLCSFAQREQ